MKSFVTITKKNTPFIEKHGPRSYSQVAQYIELRNRSLLVTSNGFAISSVRQPTVDIDGNCDIKKVNIPFCAIEDAAKSKMPVEVTKDGDPVFVMDMNASREYRPSQVEYPKWAEIGLENKIDRRITLNADFLKDLSDAITGKKDFVTLHIPDDEDAPIIVTGTRGFGVVCGIENDEKEEEYKKAMDDIRDVKSVE